MGGADWADGPYISQEAKGRPKPLSSTAFENQNCIDAAKDTRAEPCHTNETVIAVICTEILSPRAARRGD